MSKKNKKKHVNNQKDFVVRKKSNMYTLDLDYKDKNTGRYIEFKLANCTEAFVKNLADVSKLVDKAFNTGEFSIADAPHLFGGICQFATVSDEAVSLEGYLKLMLAKSNEKEFVECMHMIILTSKLLSNVIDAK